MKRGALFVLAIVAIALAAVSWIRRNTNLEPAFLPPPQDIAAILNDTGVPLVLSPGAAITVFAKDLGAPRVMAFDGKGNLFVSITKEGRIAAFRRSGGNAVGQPVTVLDRLNRPHGIAFLCENERECQLFVAESDKVAAYRYDPITLSASDKRTLARLPDGGNHFTRTIGIVRRGGEEKILISIGSSCNACGEKDPRRAKMFIMNVDGSGFREFARGLRNTVFFTEHPETGAIWGTDMGRDLLGDDIPPDEVNIIESPATERGVKDYGWPYCYGANVHDDDVDPRGTRVCREPEFTGSRIDIPAHSAPLGLAFIPKGAGWPEEYAGDLLIAYHGSWNRSVPTGYKIVRMKLDQDGNYEGTEDFISGWLTAGNEALGRPVGLVFDSVGNLYISDDKAGVIYRVFYRR